MVYFCINNIDLTRKIKIIFLFIPIFFLAGCRNNEGSILLKYCEDNHFQIDYSRNLVLVIIPYEGCNNCLNRMREFIDSMDHPFVYYIVSSFFQKDQVNLISYFQGKNFFYDPYILPQKGLVEMYPKAFVFVKKHLKEIITLKTENDYERLINHIL